MKLSLEISVSYLSGLVKGTMMQALFRIGYNGFLGLALASIF
jgi:hypothetical protein